MSATNPDREILSTALDVEWKPWSDCRCVIERGVFVLWGARTFDIQVGGHMDRHVQERRRGRYSITIYAPRGGW